VPSHWNAFVEFPRIRFFSKQINQTTRATIVPHLSGAAPALHPLEKPALHGRQLIQRQAIRQQR